MEFQHLADTHILLKVDNMERLEPKHATVARETSQIAPQRVNGQAREAKIYLLPSSFWMISSCFIFFPVAKRDLLSFLITCFTRTLYRHFTAATSQTAAARV